MKHALIIEDDFVVSDALEERLAQFGFNSFEKAWTEEGAVAAALRQKPDLVVVGDRIGAGSSIRAAHRIAEAQDVPIVLVARSSRAMPDDLPPSARLSGPYKLGALSDAVAAAQQAAAPATIA